MEKKYIKPEIEVLGMVVEQHLLEGSIDALISDETQGNGDALGRDLDDLWED